MGDYKMDIIDQNTVFNALNDFFFTYFIERDKEKILSIITDDFFAVGLDRDHEIKSKEQMRQFLESEQKDFCDVIDYEMKNFTMVLRQKIFIECFCTVIIRKINGIMHNCPYCVNVTAGFIKDRDKYYLSLLSVSEAYLSEEFFSRMFGEYKTDSYVSDQSRYAAQDMFLNMLNDAVTDPLTGIYNRRSGEALIQKALARETSFVFLVLDIDHFKEINDIYGHQEGDRILQYTVNLMRRSFRGSDIIFRLGGDEFVIFAYPCDDPKVMERKLEKMNLEYQKEIKMHYKESQSSLSFGGVCGEGEISFQTLYQKADSVLYEVKHSKQHRQMIRRIACA